MGVRCVRVRTHPFIKVFDQTFFKKFDGSRVVTLDNGLSFCKAFSLAFCFKEKALNGFRGGVRLWITCNLVVGEAWGIS